MVFFVASNPSPLSIFFHLCYNRRAPRQIGAGKENFMDILIGNVCSLLAMITDSISSTQKTTKRVLLWQNVGQVIYCVGAIFLRGYSAAVQNAVSLFRNLTAMHGRPPKWVAGVGYD